MMQNAYPLKKNQNSNSLLHTFRINFASNFNDSIHYLVVMKKIENNKLSYKVAINNKKLENISYFTLKFSPFLNAFAILFRIPTINMLNFSTINDNNNNANLYSTNYLVLNSNLELVQWNKKNYEFSISPVKCPDKIFLPFLKDDYYLQNLKSYLFLKNNKEYYNNLLINELSAKCIEVSKSIKTLTNNLLNINKLISNFEQKNLKSNSNINNVFNNDFEEKMIKNKGNTEKMYLKNLPACDYDCNLITKCINTGECRCVIPTICFTFLHENQNYYASKISFRNLDLNFKENLNKFYNNDNNNNNNNGNNNNNNNNGNNNIKSYFLNNSLEFEWKKVLTTNAYHFINNFNFDLFNIFVFEFEHNIQNDLLMNIKSSYDFDYLKSIKSIFIADYYIIESIKQLQITQLKKQKKLNLPVTTIYNADFVLIPFFHANHAHFFRNSSEKLFTNKSNPLIESIENDILKKINYNNNNNNNNNENRKVLPKFGMTFLHDFGACFVFLQNHLNYEFHTQESLMQNKMSIQALGDYNTPCFIPGLLFILFF
jgi:hypothetical protein